MIRARFRVLAGLVLLLGACSDGPSPQSLSSTPLREDERFAQAFAQTLSSDVAALQLKDALRRSLYTRHRVSLQAFVRDSQSATLVDGIAARLGTTRLALISSLAVRPPLDLVIPSREQRLTWRGSTDVIVAARFDESVAPERAFTSSGRALAYMSLRNAEVQPADAPTVVSISPSYGLALRARPQAAVDGPVVQDEGDGEYGGVTIKYLPNGDSIVTQLGDAIQAAVDRMVAARQQIGAAMRLDTPMSNVVQANKTYLKGLYIIQGEDFNSPTNPLELRWQAKLLRRSDNAIRLTQNTNMDMPNEVMQAMELPLIDAVQNPLAYVWLKLAEEDGGWWTDNYGEYQITSELPNYLNKSWVEPYYGGGAGRCGYSTPNGYFTCPLTTSYGVFYWAEVSFNLAWQPYSAPPVVATVDGPGVIMPTETYTWGAANLTGTAPYSYEWYLDGNLVGTGSTYTTMINDPASVHMLTLDVADGYGYWQQASLGVSVNTGQCQPGDPNCYESLRAGSATGAPRKRVPLPR